MKFKHLAVRIWFSFTVAILTIVLLISGFYIIAFRMTDERAKTKDLLAVHNILLKSDLSKPITFGEFQNLRGCTNFIYLDGAIHDLSKQNGKNFNAPGNGERKGMDGQNYGNNSANSKSQPGLKNSKEVENWIVSYIDDSNTTKTFKEKYFGKNYIFIISAVDSGYLISYTPNTHNNTILYIVFAIGLFAILAAVIVSKILANYISKPLKEFEQFTERISKKDFKQPIMIANQDELGELANSMNKMQEVLKRAETEEKQFLQSISHDLKTPVMVIMTHAEAIMDEIYIDTPGATAKIIRDEAIRLNKKIKQLLYFNTLDYVLDNETDNERIELSDIVNSVTGKFIPINKDITWNVTADNAEFVCNPEKITIAIENILDNMMRYAKSKIDVSLTKNQDKTEIQMFNDGDKLNDDDLKKLFNNMYKGKKGNFGLGLSISKKIINFYGGSITACNKPEGVSFTITLPN